MTQTIDRLIKELWPREGGYVNDPDDAGGPTKYGITLATIKALGMDINGDGVINTADVKALTKDQAYKIYKEEYYFKLRINSMPELIQPSLFDMSVNSGPNATRILQRLLAELDPEIIVDGIIGNHTASVCHDATERYGVLFVDAYGLMRRNYYYELGDIHPERRKYCVKEDGTIGGWIIRSQDFIRPMYHISPEDHRKRIAGW